MFGICFVMHHLFIPFDGRLPHDPRDIFDNPFLPIRLNVEVYGHLIHNLLSINKSDKQRFWS